MVAQRVGGVALSPDGQQVRAAGLVRVSTDRQGDGYSPSTQRAAILAHARALGYVLDPEDIYEDHESGHALGRKGYQAVLAGVRSKRYAAIIVFMLDRFGRDSLERQARGRELDRLGVPLLSVLEGRDEPGLIRAIRAEMSEEESRRNAQRVTPNRERAAREGTHMGMTPYGYERVYPEHTSGHQPAGQLRPSEPQASVVRELFSRYASGQWSTRDLAADLNERGVPGPGTPRTNAQARWSTGQVGRLLRNPSYKGSVRYNGKPQGRFCRAEPGSAFTVEGTHEPLVAEAVWEEVQRRLADGRPYQRVRDGRTETIVVRYSAERPLLAGLLRCAECGGLMAAIPPREGRQGELRCQRRTNGEGCTAQSYRLEPATEALLREVGRLKGAPWTPASEQALAGPDAGVRAHLGSQLSSLRARLDDATERLLDRGLSAPERASLERVHAKLCTQITALEEQQAQLAHDAQALPRLRALHAKLRSTELGPLCGRLLEQGNTVAVRDLIRELVASAVLVERWPEHRSTWVRLAVTWQPDVQVLLDAGLLWLDPA